MARGKQRPGTPGRVSFAELAARQPRQVKLVLPPDDDAGDQLQKAVDAARNAAETQQLRAGFYSEGAPEKTDALSQLPGLQAELAAAEAALEAASTVMVIRALPRPDLEALRQQHPPTEEQVAEAEKDVGGKPLANRDTFEPALIAACIVADPPITPAEVVALRDGRPAGGNLPAVEGWSKPDWEQLVDAVTTVNSQSRIRQLGN